MTTKATQADIRNHKAATAGNRKALYAAQKKHQAIQSKFGVEGAWKWEESVIKAAKG